MSKLIILRGNSASGKTTTAKMIQDSFARGKVMKISQNDVRLGILNVKDRIENPTAKLIENIAEFGKNKCDTVVIEGILGSHIYEDMFISLYKSFEGNVFSYYWDIPFEETLIRHSKRDLAKVFGKERMKNWWLGKDMLDLPNEKILTKELSQEEIVDKILKDIDD